jgi:hypothetical protein
MNAEDQGRFIVGYYHQRQSFFTPNPVGKTIENIDEQTIIENGGTENE